MSSRSIKEATVAPTSRLGSRFIANRHLAGESPRQAAANRHPAGVNHRLAAVSRQAAANHRRAAKLRRRPSAPKTTKASCWTTRWRVTAICTWAKNR